MDMIAALKWCNQHRRWRHPKKVMIFGHGAGAAATCIVGLSAGEGIVFLSRQSGWCGAAP
jgi:carboxylesterase type B